MAPATYDREWLKAGIAAALSWDVFVVEGVVDAIEAAGAPPLPSHPTAQSPLQAGLPYA